MPARLKGAAATDVSTIEKPRFDLEALQQAVSETIFARGQDYHRRGQVTLLSIEPARVLARVSGTEDYRTVLTGRGTKIGGECSCRAFEDRGFCKHMVATALAANDAGPEADDAGVLGRIRRHLKNKSVDALAEMIVTIAEHDAELFRRLELMSAAVEADDKTLEARLRKMVDAATRTSHYIDYRAAADWADGVGSVLDTLEELAPGNRAEMVLRLAGRAIDNVEEAIEDIDDSDGHCSGLLERAAEIHLAAAQAAQPDQVSLARELFAREVGGGYDTFTGAVATYAEVLGDVGLAEYRRLAAEAWAKLPPRTANARTRNEVEGNYGELMAILDFFAERDDDVEARIALRSKELSSSWRYLQLAQFCQEQGRSEEALRHAEEGLWLFDKGRPDERLLLFAVDLLTKAGRKGDAEARIWRAFEKAPSRELYARLRKLGGEAAGERALTFLEAQLGKQPQWLYLDLLVRILIDQQMFERAWRIVGKHQASKELRHALSLASERTHPREALETYIERVEGLVGTSLYEEAVKLIARMAKLRSAAEQTAYVTALKERHARKRNLMKLLA